MYAGGVVLGPAGAVARPPAASVGSLVLNDGQQLVSHVGAGDPEDDVKKAAVAPEPEKPRSAFSKAISVLSAIFVLAAAGLSLADAYFLKVAMDCLEEPNGSRALYLTLSVASVFFSLAGIYVKIMDAQDERRLKRVDDQLEAAAIAQYRVRARKNRRNMGQMMEDASIFLAILPTILGIILRQADILSKIIAVVSVVAALLPFGTPIKEEYMCRKLVSLLVLLVAVGLLFLTFFAIEHDKSLVFYHFTDSRTNQTFRLAREEDQVAFDGVSHCDSPSGNPCVPCFLTAVHGRGNNTWFPQNNDTGQCAGVTITAQEAFDCTNLGSRVPLTVSIYAEDTCALDPSLKCYMLNNTGTYEAI